MVSAQTPVAAAIDQLCRFERLGFRAACNSAIEAGSRPVKPRVVRRLEKLPDAQEIFQISWVRAIRDDPSIVEQRFYEILAQDPLWRTLVGEEIVQDARWLNLDKFKVLAKFLDQAGALWDKVFNEKSHPVARGSATLAVGLTGLWTIHAVSGGAVSIPVTLSPGKAQPSEMVVPVRFVATGDTGEVGVRLKVTPLSDPLQMPVPADPAQVKEIVNAMTAVAVQIQANTHSVNTLVLQLAKKDAGDGHFDESRLALSLDRIGSRLDEFKSAYEKYANDELNITRENLPKVHAGLKVVASASVSPYLKIPASLQRQKTQSIVLPTFDTTSGNPSFTALTICLNDILSDALSVKVATATEKENMNDCKGHNLQAYSLGVAAHIGILPWRITVNSIERHWIGPDVVAITLSPLMPAATPDVAAAKPD